MAIPPAPIGDVLPRAAAIVEAMVVDVLWTESSDAGPGLERPGAADRGLMAPEQLVLLEVRDVLRGPYAAGSRVRALKPRAPYALRAGNHGPFLLDDGAPIPTILGRYGPDSYGLEAVRAVLAG